jgi:two-component system LytT family sensor kinase
MPGSGHLRRAAAILACWIFLGLLFAPQTYLINLRAPRPLTIGEALSANAIVFLVWAALTPLALRLGRRFPLERGRLGRHLLLHAAAALVFSAAHLVVVGQLNRLLAPRSSSAPLPIVGLLVGLGATDVMIYTGLVAVSQAIMYFGRYREREMHLVQARLQLLAAQLHPHLLFNTLNAIAELIHQDPPRAERTLTQLSDLLRLALDGRDRQDVALAEEIAVLRSYVEIQRTLLQERLAVHWAIDPDTLEARVPGLLLQPLVENAVQHGIGPRAAGGAVTIGAQRSDDSLVLTVSDNGVGMGQPSSAAANGIGLANTRARLEQLYGSAHRFEIGERAGGGGAVVISIPFRTRPDHD